MSAATGGHYRITVPAAEGGKHYAVRDHTGTLTATGWLDEEGVAHPDVEALSGKPRIDGGNPAAMVPVSQKWE